jgi:EpsG family
MLIYWLLFAYPALFALAYPAVQKTGGKASAGQRLALIGFVVFYTLLAGLRQDVGGDWINYQVIYDDIRLDTLSYALSSTDPLYGALNWISAQMGAEIYLVNGICGLLLVWGVTSASSKFSEPWLAIAMAVPYLLIVVGLGYVRQGAAIGMLLLAISAYERGRIVSTIVMLFIAIGFHSTAVMVFPLFGWALSRRYPFLAVIFVALSVVTYIAVVIPRIEQFDASYLQTEYDSTGAVPRVLMSAVPAALVLARLRSFAPDVRSRSVWISMAATGLFALFALAVSPSTTAVDRAALFFSPVQMAAYGEFRALSNLSQRAPLLYRSALILLAAFVQVVWLIFATNAPFWVPYHSLFEGGTLS